MATPEMATLAEIAHRLGCPASVLGTIASGVPHCNIDGLHLWPVAQVIERHRDYTSRFGTVQRRYRRSDHVEVRARVYSAPAKTLNVFGAAQ